MAGVLFVMRLKKPVNRLLVALITRTGKDVINNFKVEVSMSYEEYRELIALAILGVAGLMLFYKYFIKEE